MHKVVCLQLRFTGAVQDIGELWAEDWLIRPAEAASNLRKPLNCHV